MTIDRWRKWSKTEKLIGKNAEIEPSKPSEATFGGFEGSVLAKIPINLCPSGTFSLPEYAPGAWQEDLDRWLPERCLHRDGYEDYGGVGSLWRDFVEWSLANNEVPCPELAFAPLLKAAGWEIVNNMVCGLFLREDLWVLRMS